MEKIEISMSEELLEKWNEAKLKIGNVILNQDMGFISFDEMRKQIIDILKIT